MDEQQLFLGYATSVVFALGVGYFGLKHRGSIKTDRERHLNISRGDGLAVKIISHYPSYKIVAPIVDHIVGGVAMTAGLGGGIGLGLSGLGFDSVLDSAMLPFYQGALAYLIVEGSWEIDTFCKRPKSQYGLGDILQIGADLGSVAGTVYVASQIFR